MSTKKKIITVIIGVEAVIIAAVIVFLFYINSDTVKVNRQLELAQKYLLEEDYEQAIAVFEGIIEIDPKNEEAYLGMAEAYAKVDDLENAVKILEKASKRVDSEEVLAMLETHTAEIEQRQQAAQRAAEAASQAAADAAASSEQTAAEASPQDMDAAETQTPEAEMVLTGFIVQDGELYYYDETGNYVTGWFDKNDNRYCARDDGRLYKDGEHEIDSTKYLFDQGGVCLGEVEEDAWKQAYIDIINNCDLNGAGYYENGYQYNLIYFDNDDIPELLVDDKGYCLYLYTYADDKICTIMDEYFYGTWGRSYDYFERKSVIGSFSYYFDNVDNELQIACYDIDKMDGNYKFTDHLYSEYAMEEDGRESYTYNDMEITEEEYNSYLQNEFHISSNDSAIGMYGSKDADEMIQEILSY